MFDKKLMLKVFITLSIVALLGDIVYEGARSVSGAYLNFLAAPTIAAGLLAVGEVLSYLMRLVGGVIAQKTYSPKKFWSMIYIGYSVNLVIPLLALTNNWFIALILYFIERIGKGLRAPVRDLLISEVSEGIGKGKGFGIHEVVDQVGAIAGPSILGVLLAYHPDEIGLGFKLGFSILGIPAILLMIVISYAYIIYPKPIAARIEKTGLTLKNLKRSYWLYLGGSTSAVMGLLYWGFISYYLQDVVKLGVINQSEIPLIYIIAMVTDALIAVPMGVAYDRYRVFSLLLIPLVAIPIPFFLFMHVERTSLYIASIFLGLSMGGIETVMRASVADIVDYSSRPIAYGIQSTAIGFSVLLGGLIDSYLYQINMTDYIILVTLFLEISAISSYIVLIKYGRQEKPLLEGYNQ
ncbi:MAG: MFS transporter [Nitrososphaerota archaeon]